jgi:hypothetical protein
MKLAVEIHTTDVNELCTFGVHTGHRDTDVNVNLCLDKLATYAGAVQSTLAQNTITALVAYEWDTVPGYTGWHQRIRRTVATAGGSGSKLPPQCAAVLGYRADSVVFSSTPIGSRRNRFYLGPLATSAIGTDGLMTATYRTNMLTALTSLHTDLSAVTGTIHTLLDRGLVVVSPAQDAYMPADRVSMGKVVDTMRSRRQLEPESPTVNTITPA